MDYLLPIDASQVANLVAIGTASVAATWVLFRYFFQNEFFPKVEFSVDMDFKVERDNLWIVEVLCTIQNFGLVRCKVPDLSFTIHGLQFSDEPSDGQEEINFQTNFPHIVKKGAWIPKTWNFTFIEPKTTQTYRHIATIPKSFEAIVLHGYMKYGRFSADHTANRLISVPKSPVPT